MIRNNRYYTDESINIPQNNSLATILGQQIKSKTDPNAPIAEYFAQRPTKQEGLISYYNPDYLATETEEVDNDRLNSAVGLGKSGLKIGQSYFGSGSGSTPWGAIATAAKNGYNLITDKSPDEYSDFEQTMIYPVQGAATGAQFGPWGAAGGALYGLGYSFKDDLGLEDDNFLTNVLFPIGMGDGGGFIDLGQEFENGFR